MARSRDFDLDAATDAAVRLFWQQGYAATSVRQLCDAIGIQPGSFYAAFGSKEACFQRALARYLATQDVPREPAPAAIRRWFDAICDPARAPRGCLLVGSAVELPMLDDASRRAVQQALGAIERFFARCLADHGDDAKDHATLLAAAVTAIHVMARAGVPAAKLRVVARQAMASVGLAVS